MLLAIDTATSHGSVALATRDGTPVCETALHGQRQAAGIVPSIDHCLAVAGVDYADLTGIVLGDGPGSFTGLRVAFATARGIVAAHPAIALAVAPSLRSVALLASRWVDGPVAVAFEALRDEVFLAAYEVSEGSVVELLAPGVMSADRLPSLGLRPAVCVGDGAWRHPEVVKAWTGREPVGFPAAAPQARYLIELTRLPGGVTPVDAAQLVPVYGRPAEAQARWESEHGRSLPGAPR